MIKNLYNKFWYLEPEESLVGLDSKQIKEQEKRLGVKFPRELVKLYKISDGGIPDLDLEHESAIAQSCLPQFLKLSELNLTSNNDLYSDVIPGNLIILGSHGHDYYALDYRKNNSKPSIVYGDGHGHLETLSDSFKGFLKYLVDPYENMSPEFKEIDELFSIDTLDSAKRILEKYKPDFTNEYGMNLCEIAASYGALEILMHLHNSDCNLGRSHLISQNNNFNSCIEYLENNA